MYGKFIIIIVIISLLITCVTANGRLIEPPMRSSLWRFDSQAAVNFNDHALDCGGPQVQYKINRGRCGVCGDPFNANRENELGGRYDSKIIARRYRTGSDITMVADLLSAKGGFIEIKLCPRNDPTVPVTQACFDQYPLRITNGRGRRLRVGDSSTASDGLYRLDVRLPKGVACTHCVIQWRYHAENEWGYDANGRGCLGCGPQTDIYNCADVTIGYVGDKEASPGQPDDLSMGPLSKRIELYSEGTGVSTFIVNSDRTSAWASGNDLTTNSRGRNNNNNMAGADHYYDADGMNVDYGDASGGYANLLSAIGGNMYDYNTEDDYGFNAMIMMMGAGGGSGSSEESDFRSGNRKNSFRQSSVRNSGARRGSSRGRGQQQQRRRGGGGGGGSSGGSSEEESGRRNNGRNNRNNRNNAMVIPSLSRQYNRMNAGRSRNGGGSSSSEEDDDYEGRVNRGNNGNRQSGPANARDQEKLIDGLNELADRFRNNNNNDEEDEDEEGDYNTNTNNNVPAGNGNANTRPNYPNGRNDYENPDGNDYGGDYGMGSKTPSEFDSTDVPPYFQGEHGNTNGNGGYGTDTDGIDYSTGNGGYDGNEPSGNGGYNNQGQTPTSSQGGGYNNQGQTSTSNQGGGYNNNNQGQAPTSNQGGGYNNQGQTPTSNQEGGYNNNNQGQAPTSNQGGGYNNNNQGQAPTSNQGGGYNNQGQTPTSNQGGGYNNNNQGQEPTSNQGGGYNNQGQTPTSNQGGGYNNQGQTPTSNQGGGYNNNNQGQAPTSNQGGGYNTPTPEPGARRNGDSYYDYEEKTGTNQNGGGYGPNGQSNSNNYDEMSSSRGTGQGGSGYDTKNQIPSTTTGGSGYSNNNQNVEGHDNHNHHHNNNNDHHNGGKGNNVNTDGSYGNQQGTSTGGYNDAGDGYDDDDLGQITDVEESGTGIKLPYTHQPGQLPPLLPRADENREDRDDRRPSSKKKRVGPLPWYMALMGTWPYNYQLGLHNQYQMGPWGVHLNPSLMASSYGRGQAPFSHIAALLSTLNAPRMANAPTKANPAYYAYANNKINNGARSANRVLPWMPSATEVMAMGARRSPIFSPQIANNYLSSFMSLSHSHPSLQCQRPDQLICVATPAYRGIPNADQICTSKCRSGEACGSDYCSCACQKTLMCVHHASPKGAGNFGVTEMDMWCTNQCNAGQCPNQLCACNILF